MNTAFKHYVTGTAFALALSKRQIEMLCHLHQQGGSSGLLTTFYALQAKGLVERASSEEGVVDRKWQVRLTEAGRAVIPLLILAGLYVEDVSVQSAPEPALEAEVIHEA